MHVAPDVSDWCAHACGFNLQWQNAEWSACARRGKRKIDTLKASGGFTRTETRARRCGDVCTARGRNYEGNVELWCLAFWREVMRRALGWKRSVSRSAACIVRVRGTYVSRLLRVRANVYMNPVFVSCDRERRVQHPRSNWGGIMGTSAGHVGSGDVSAPHSPVCWLWSRQMVEDSFL